MASRQDLKETLYDQLLTLTSQWMTSEDVRYKDPHLETNKPPVVTYEEFEYPVWYNRGSDDSADGEIRDSNGNLTHEVYGDTNGLRFDIGVYGINEPQKEPIYQAIYTYFKKFHRWKATEEFHHDVFKIRLTGTKDGDKKGADGTLRGDRISVKMEYVNYLEREVDEIKTVNSNLDTDDDEEVERTETTT